MLALFAALLLLGGLATPRRERGAFWAAIVVLASVGALLMVRGA
jgi:hypothetical protein